jgi:hypothetical protein
VSASTATIFSRCENIIPNTIPNAITNAIPNAIPNATPMHRPTAIPTATPMPPQPNHAAALKIQDRGITELS